MKGRKTMGKSEVYFTSFKATGNENLLQKLHRLMKTVGFEQIDFKDKYAAIKIHFGEYGNLAFLRMKYRTVHGDVWHTVPSLRFTSRIWRRHLNII